MKAIIDMGNNIRLEVEEKDEMETLHRAIVFASPRNKCICGNADGFYFTTNKDTEGNIYVNYKCPKCSARSKLGRYKAGGFFWHEFEVYNPEAKKGQE